MESMITDIDAFYDQITAAAEHEKHNRWLMYQPYSKQIEFMNAGATIPERLLIAGNQVGKTDCGAFEISRHLTGVYPPWWKGLRFDQNTGPCDIWAGGTSGVSVRDGPQAKLFGKPGVAELFGTGFIPKDCIMGEPSSSRSATSAYDTAHIRHISGGVSDLGFKTYAQSREDWQGPTKKLVWFDEEPPSSIFSEGMARTAATGGRCMMTFTPLKGFTEVVKRWLECEQAYAYRRMFIQMAMTDAAHMTPELIEATLSIYPRHEWPARRNGDPHLAGGLIFLANPDDLKEEPFGLLPGSPNQVPGWWHLLWAIDFTHSGSDASHPFAAVLGAFDREADTCHILTGFKTSESLPILHAARIKAIGANVPVAWPHDGYVKDLKGEELREMYAAEKLNMLGEHATFTDGGYSTEAGIMDLDTAMRTGHFKVNRLFEPWFQEMRMYHREEDSGKIVKINDDLMSATRILWMMRRAARQVPLGSALRKPRRLNSAQRINPFTGRPENGR